MSIQQKDVGSSQGLKHELWSLCPLLKHVSWSSCRRTESVVSVSKALNDKRGNVVLCLFWWPWTLQVTLSRNRERWIIFSLTSIIPAWRLLTDNQSFSETRRKTPVSLGSCGCHPFVSNFTVHFSRCFRHLHFIRVLLFSQLFYFTFQCKNIVLFHHYSSWMKRNRSTPAQRPD